MPHFLDSCLTDGGEVINLTCWLKHFLVLFSVRDWISYNALVQLEGLSKLKKFSGIIKYRTHDLACGMIPQPTMQAQVCKALSVAHINVCDIARWYMNTEFRMIWE
jgi:hypothetical protein